MFTSMTAGAGVASCSVSMEAGAQCASPIDRIVICLSSALIAEALQVVIARHSDGEVIAHRTTIEQAIHALRQAGARTLIFDAPHDDPSVVAATVRALREQAPDARLILFTAHRRAAYLEAVVGLDLDGCLLQVDHRECLIDALQVPADERYVSPSVRRRVAARRTAVLHRQARPGARAQARDSRPLQ